MVNCVWMVVIRGCLSRPRDVTSRCTDARNDCRYDTGNTAPVVPVPVKYSSFWLLAAMGALWVVLEIGDPKSAKSEHLVTNECTPHKLKRHTHLRQIVVQE